MRINYPNLEDTRQCSESDMFRKASCAGHLVHDHVVVGLQQCVANDVFGHSPSWANGGRGSGDRGLCPLLEHSFRTTHSLCTLPNVVNRYRVI